MQIKVKGARVHNLQNLNVEIPKDQFVVMTGVSGSGKSSLAFDTIYAEGQRRYVESLSSYARQFLGLMDKPDVDKIDGLSPAISIDQKTVSHNPRSTVGTTTEIYDYLRVLFARLGHPRCPHDNTEITKLSLDEIVTRLINQIEITVKENPAVPQLFELLSPVVRGQKGEFRDLLANLVSKGYRQAYIDNQLFSLDEDISLLKTNKHNIQAVIDQFSVQKKDLKDEIFLANLRSRLSTSVEQATSLALGLVVLKTKAQTHLYSENYACSTCGHSLPEIEPRMFSFNSPLGACETCKGLGTVEHVDPDRIMNKRLSYKQGGILPLNYLLPHETWYTRLIETVAKVEGVSLTTPLGKLTDRELQILLFGTAREYRVVGTNRHGRTTSINESWPGIVAKLEEKYFSSESDWSRQNLSQYIVTEICETCLGKKLKPEILSITIDSLNIIDITEFSITTLLSYLKHDLPKKMSDYELAIGQGILKEIISRLTFLDNVGLGYLTLARKSKTLSGGEQQRIRLASQIGTGLTGVLYVLDEPSIGLHSRDVAALIGSLRELVELGNSLIVVEHDEETIRSADYLIELGPLAGSHGGRIVAEGHLSDIMSNPNSLTGQYLSGKQSIPLDPPPLINRHGTLKLIGCCENNLKDLSLSLPLGNLIGVTGVSGSGKSSLITDTLYPALRYYLNGSWSDHMGVYDRLEGYQYLSGVDLVDQSPIGRTPRSNPATYVGLFDDIRDIFASTPDARLKGFKKGRFSFNLKGGRCEKCQGGGVIKIEMQFLPDVYVECDVCHGKRYNHETLAIKYKGLSIYDVLAMTIAEASDFFKSHSRIYRRLNFLQEVGLDYLTLGQPAPTLSGGEAQRIKLAAELGKRVGTKTLYILDEPTTGLHFHDVNKLLNTLKKLVAQGNTVVVIEHNLDVIKNCNYLLDLGPEGGDAGGQLLYQGETTGLLSTPSFHTAKYLAKYL